MKTSLLLFSSLGLATASASLACGSAAGGAEIASGDAGAQDAHVDAAPAAEASAPDATPSDGALEAAADSSVAAVRPRCGDTPTLLASTKHFYAPDAGPVALSPPGIAVNPTDLLYTSETVTLDTQIATGGLWRVPIQGGVPTQLASVPGIVLYAATATSAIYADNRSGVDAQNLSSLSTVYSLPVVGGAPTTLFATTTEYGYLANDQKSVYFADAGGVESVPLTGGAVHNLTTIAATSAIVLGENLVFADTGGDLLQVPLTGGAPTQLVPSRGTSARVLACGASLCWTTAPRSLFASGGRFRGGGLFELDGTSSRALIPAGIDSPLSFLAAIVNDGASFYWSAGDSGATLSTLSSDGGATSALVVMPSAGDVAVNDACLYWTNTEGIYTVSKTSPGPFPFTQ
jgi:hypothetical protein